MPSFDTQAVIKRWLRLQLRAARQAQLSVVDAIKQITERLEWIGMDRGFLPVNPLEIKPDFAGAKVVVEFTDYETEATIEV